MPMPTATSSSTSPSRSSGTRSTVRYVATVAKGQNLADQIPGIDDFIKSLNARLAG